MLPSKAIRASLKTDVESAVRPCPCLIETVDCRRRLVDVSSLDSRQSAVRVGFLYE